MPVPGVTVISDEDHLCSRCSFQKSSGKMCICDPSTEGDFMVYKLLFCRMSHLFLFRPSDSCSSFSNGQNIWIPVCLGIKEASGKSKVRDVSRTGNECSVQFCMRGHHVWYLVAHQSAWRQCHGLWVILSNVAWIWRKLLCSKMGVGDNLSCLNVSVPVKQVVTSDANGGRQLKFSMGESLIFAFLPIHSCTLMCFSWAWYRQYYTEVIMPPGTIFSFEFDNLYFCFAY